MVTFTYLQLCGVILVALLTGSLVGMVTFALMRVAAEADEAARG